jgi:hypothetical protein
VSGWLAMGHSDPGARWPSSEGRVKESGQNLCPGG